MCISIYSVEFFQKMYDVIKFCDDLEILKRQIKVIFILCVNMLEVEIILKFVLVN